jgi:hypothetical protein
LLKRKTILSTSALDYLKKYKSTYNQILIVAKQRANDCIILNSSNQTKALWNVIKNETGKGFIQNQNISLQIDSMLVTNPQYVSHYFNDHFV